MPENVDKDRLQQWEENALPVESAERLKALSAPSGSRPLKDASFARCNSNVYHLVLPDEETGEISKTAMCGYTATVEIPFPRYAHGDTRWEDGTKIFIGMGAIVRESNEGWKFGRRPDGVNRKLCERCRKKWNRIVSENDEARHPA